MALDSGGGGIGDSDTDTDADTETSTVDLEEAQRELRRRQPSGIDAGEPISGVDGQGSPRDDREPSPVEGGSDSVDGMGSGPTGDARDQLTNRDPGGGGSSGGPQDRGTGITSGSGDVATGGEQSRNSTPVARDQLTETDPGSGGSGTPTSNQGGQGQTADELASTLAEENVDTTLEEGAERSDPRARAFEQQVIEGSDRVDSPSDIAIRQDGDRLVAELSRSAQIGLLESRYRQGLRSGGAATFLSDRRPTGTGITPGRALGPTQVVDLDEDVRFTREGGDIQATLTDEAGQDVTEQRIGDRGGGADSAIEANLREQFASENEGVEPSDVSISQENGTYVASATVQSEGQRREEDLLPSVDVDLSNRSVTYESGNLSAIPEPTPARLFGTVTGLEEEEIQTLEQRAEQVDEDTQGAPPVGLGGGRALPARAIAAGAGVLGAGVVASGRTATQSSRESGSTTISTAEVGLGSGISQTEVGLGQVTSGQEIDVTEASIDISELQPEGGGPTATTVEPSDGVASSEIGLPGGQSDSTSSGTGQRDETVTPGEYPLPGRDLPRNPREDRPEQVDPTDLIDTGLGTSPLQQQRQGRVEESTAVEEELRRRRRSRNPELEEILRGPSGEVTIGRQDEFAFRREFPTGASAVVGSGIARLEDAQRPEATVDTEMNLDVGTRQIEGVRPDTAPLTGTITEQGQETSQGVSPRTATDFGQVLETAQQNVALNENVVEPMFQTENLYENEVVTETVNSTGRITTPSPLPGIELPPADNQKSRDAFAFGGEQFIVDFAEPEDVIGESRGPSLDFGI